MDPLVASMILLKMALAGCGLQITAMLYFQGKKTKKTGTAYVGKAKEIKRYLGINGIKLSKNIQLSFESMFGHVGIFGKTGSYKSSAIYIPNLLSNFFPRSSLIISDVKGELFRISSWYQRNICKREVLILSPLDPSNSIGYNPLAICNDITDIRKLAQTLVSNASLSSTNKSSGGAEWDTMATPLLCSALLYCKDTGGEQCNISTALDIVISHTDKELETLFSNSTTEVIDQWNIFKTALGAKGASSSIKITLASALQSFLDYKITKVTSKNEFRPEYLREKPIALYIIYPETKADYLAPLMATIFSQLIDVNLDYYDNNNNCLPIFNFLDEFANLGFLPSFNHTITAARSRNFSLNLCIHDVRQLFKIYGQDLTYNICNNLTTKVILGGISEPYTLEYISSISGDTEITVSSESRTGDKTTVSYNKQTKKLYTPNEVRCLKDETAIIIINNKQVVADKLNIYFKNKIYDERIKEQYL